MMESSGRGNIVDIYESEQRLRMERAMTARFHHSIWNQALKLDGGFLISFMNLRDRRLDDDQETSGAPCKRRHCPILDWEVGNFDRECCNSSYEKEKHRAYVI